MHQAVAAFHPLRTLAGAAFDPFPAISVCAMVFRMRRSAMSFRESRALFAVIALAAASISDPGWAAPARSAAATHSFRDCKGCPELIAIPSGSFLMGTPRDEEGKADWDF